MTSSNGQYGSYKSDTTGQKGGVAWADRNFSSSAGGWLNAAQAAGERPHKQTQQCLSFQQSQRQYLTAPPSALPVQQGFSWLPRTSPGVGSPPCFPGEDAKVRQREAVPISLQDDPEELPAPGPAQDSFSSSQAQHRFDEIFMNQPSIPPPPPPRQHPLVPQQIRRKIPPTKRPGRPACPQPREEQSIASNRDASTELSGDSDSSEVAVRSKTISRSGLRSVSSETTSLEVVANTRQRVQAHSHESVKRHKADENAADLSCGASRNVMKGSGSTSFQGPKYALSEGSSVDDLSPLSNEPSKRTVESSSNSDMGMRQKKRKQLELLRAKVALAKQKKVAMEKKATIEETQDALERARAKLRGALNERARAQTRTLPPISGLSTSLIISNISSTGPEDTVYFPSKDMDSDLGLGKLNELLCAVESTTEVPGSLAARKSQLRRELLLLKEKLETQQNDSSIDLTTIGDQNFDTSVSESKVAPTKQELERRKVEAQAQMDLSYWKHFVSKQEHILSEVTSQLQDNLSSLKSCDLDLARTTDSIQSLNVGIQDLEARERIISDLVSEVASNLLKKRVEFRSLEEKCFVRTA